MEEKIVEKPKTLEQTQAIALSKFLPRAFQKHPSLPKEVKESMEKCKTKGAARKILKEHLQKTH